MNESLYMDWYLLITVMNYIHLFYILDIISSPKANLLLSANEKTHRLPLYHPQHLLSYILWGRYNVAKDGLNVLYYYISLMRKANKEIKDIPSPLWTLFEEEVNIIVNDNAL